MRALYFAVVLGLLALIGPASAQLNPGSCSGVAGNVPDFGPGGACQDSGTALSAVSSPLFGTGTDGTVTISSGTTTLTRDMHYANLTINGTGILKTGGYRIFVSSTLDVSAAQTGAISGSAVAGNSASGATGGASPTTPYNAAGSTVPVTPQTLGTGGTGNTTTGTNPTQNNATTSIGVSAHGGAGGAGGAGVSAGAAGLVGQTLNSSGFVLGSTPPSWLPGNGFPAGMFPVSIGFAGGPGGQGGGDATNAGGGGGGPGSAPAGIFIVARIIQRGTNTNASVIQSIGGAGGGGGNAAGGNAGGGAGGGGASGGVVFIETLSLLGSTITNGLDVSGGAGGAGGNGLGIGKGGTGGSGGGGGGIAVVNLSTPSATVTQSFPVGTAATTATTTAGTVGGASATVQANL